MACVGNVHPVTCAARVIAFMAETHAYDAHMRALIDPTCENVKYARIAVEISMMASADADAFEAQLVSDLSKPHDDDFVNDT